MSTIISDAVTRTAENKFSASDELGRNQVTPLNDDWSEMLATQFTYADANQVEITGFDAREKFEVGNSIRITQGDVDKYFKIFTVGADYLLITAGTEYTFTNATIQRVAMSTNPFPFGAPKVYEWDANVRASVGTYSNVDPDVYQQYHFSLVGNICTMIIYDYLGSLTNNTIVLLDPPIDADFNISVPNMTIIVNDNFNIIQGYMKFGGASLIEVGRWSGGTLSPFTATTNGLFFSAQFLYVINSEQSAIV